MIRIGPRHGCLHLPGRSADRDRILVVFALSIIMKTVFALLALASAASAQNSTAAKVQVTYFFGSE